MAKIHDRDFIQRLELLKMTDPDECLRLVLDALKTEPDAAVEDNVDAGLKTRAMRTLLKHFEEREEYEDCAFLRDLQKRIDDAEKGQVPSNE